MDQINCAAWPRLSNLTSLSIRSFFSYRYHLSISKLTDNMNFALGALERIKSLRVSCMLCYHQRLPTEWPACRLLPVGDQTLWTAAAWWILWREPRFETHRYEYCGLGEISLHRERERERDADVSSFRSADILQHPLLLRLGNFSFIAQQWRDVSGQWADMGHAFAITGNYGFIMLLLAVYAVYVPLLSRGWAAFCELMCIMLSLTNYLLLIAMAFLVGGFALINKFGVYYSFWYVSSKLPLLSSWFMIYFLTR